MSYSEQPNINYIKEIANGDHEFEAQLITIIKKEFPLEIKEYEKSVELKEFEQTAAHVHKLKHKVNIFGLSEGYQIAADFENELKQGTATKLPEFNLVLETIQNYLKVL